MTARWLPADEPFYREWNARGPAARRSLARASHLARELDVDLHRVPVLTVVGSKGKGTAVAYASAVAHAAGCRVGSVTSPPFRTNAERIRVDGVAIDDATYARVSADVEEALGGLGGATDGYLSPSGAYLMAALRLFARAGTDLVVVEEGIGGASDEVSLLAPLVVAVTPVFGEHLGLIGDDAATIARDLLAVVGPGTAEVWSAPQPDAVARVVAESARAAGAAAHPDEDAPAWARRATRDVPGLGGANATLGCAAGAALARLAGHPVDDAAATAAAATVRLPGRLSVHPPSSRRRGTWVVDAAIDPVGVRAALAWCRDHVGAPARVLACFPAIKDAAGCFAALPPDVVPVTVGETYLEFDGATPATALPARDALAAADEVSGVVLCVGTVSFVAEALEHLDAPTGAHWVR